MARIKDDDDYVTIDRSWFRDATMEAIETFFLPVTALFSAYRSATRPRDEDNHKEAA